ncbi:MAG TPA: FtsX-like permease family protein [Gemmatimonadaceae bacterium]|nr:FtsX-like permease family protein [Gemmatimonadaceae bacterium]
MRAIDRKLLRDLRRHWLQVLSIAAVMGCAVMTIAGLQSTIRGLQRARDDYFTRHRFADVFATLQRAPLATGRALAAIPGVAAVDLRVVKNVRLDVPGLADPAIGHVVSIPAVRGPMINEPFVREGRWIAPGRDDEVLISERFAGVNGLHPGDSLGAVVNGRWRRLHVVGVALSPEFVVEGAMGPFSDSRRYGILWAPRRMLDAAFDMEGAFNDVAVRLSTGADERAVLAALDRELAPWGGAGAYGREDHVMVTILRNEFSQLRTNVTVFSSFFLIVSAFLLNVVLSRLVAAQREELAALKAFGYTNAEVGRHYLAFAVGAVTLGAVLGVPGGAWMGHAFTNLYAAFFKFPSLSPAMDAASVVPGIAVSGSFALLGALAAVRRAAALPPAQALRPETPGRTRPLLLEYLKLGHVLSPSARLVFRNLERRPFRTLTSMVAVGLAIAILIAGLFPYDVFAVVRRVEFTLANRQDFTVSFTGPQPARAFRELQAIPGVRAVEPFRTAPVRLHGPARTLARPITGIIRGGDLHRIVDVNGAPYALPADGLILSRGVADELGVRTGDTIRVELLEKGVTRGVAVVGTVDEMMALGGYMDLDALRALLREGDAISGAYVAALPGAEPMVSAAFKRFPGVAGAARRSAMIQSFEEQTSQSILLVMSLVVFSAGVIAAGVVYNNARIAVSERGRELGSLRVLGYTRGEITAMLLGEEAIVTAGAIPPGLAFGLVFSLAIAGGFKTSHYHFPFTLSAHSLLVAVGVVVGISALASGVVWQLVSGLDIVAALKTRE